MPSVDYRARLQPKDLNQADDILGPKDAKDKSILWPLYSTRGVLFPYTPSISTGMTADYEQKGFIHSNYGYNSYIKSQPKPIALSAKFTAQTNDEAMYMLAVIHFFRAVTKMYFGVNPYKKAGTPPPTLLFSYLGDYQFNRVPVVVKSFDFTYDENTEFVPVNTASSGEYSKSIGVNMPLAGASGYTFVPTLMVANIEMDTQYIPIKIRNEFNLDKFRSGNMLGKGYI